MNEDKNIFTNRNYIEVLTYIYRNRRISRADLARTTGLTPATVSHVVSELEKADIIRKTGHGESKGGRRPILIELNPHAFYLAGVDLGITKVNATVIDLHGTLLSRVKNPVDARDKRDIIISCMFETARQAFTRAGDQVRKKVIGIGLSVSGLVNIERGVSIFAPNIPDWQNVPIAELFRKEFSIPAFIENDARAMALGEARFGAGFGYDNIFCVNIGHGIGSGILIGGELYRGNAFTAGEFGHLTLLPSGPYCQCGNRGCLEVMAGGHAIAASAIRCVNAGAKTAIRDIVEGKIHEITAAVVSQAAQRGDSTAVRLLQEAGRYLGIGLAGAVNILGPELIIIGGGVAQSGDVLLDEIKKTISKRAFTTMVNKPSIVLSALGENASSIGAAALVLSRTLKNPSTFALRNP